MGGSIEHVSNLSQLQSHIDKAGTGLVVVDFHATWCGPCHAIARASFFQAVESFNVKARTAFYEQMASKYTSAKFLKCDVDAAQPVAQSYSIRAMPSFVFIKGGKKVETVQGANRNAIESALKKYVGASASNPDGHSWGSGNTLGDGTKQSAPIHPQQAVEAAKNLSPQLVMLLGLLAVWLYFTFVKG